MTDPSTSSNQKILLASGSTISLQASDSGPFVSASPAGQTIDLFGQAPAPVDLSAKPAKGKASPTRGTFGRNGFGSSKSAGLACSLASSLMRRSTGSILFKLTWKAVATPSGRLFYLLRASEAPTDDIALGSWPTPTTPSGGQSVPPGTTVGGRRPDGSKATVTLEMVAKATAWPTPTAGDGNRGAGGDPHGPNVTLNMAAALASWATPAMRDYRTPNLESFADRGGLAKGEQLNNQVIHKGPALNGSSAEIASGARLSPDLPRWLLRIPPVWVSCGVSAMESTLRRSRS